MTLKNIKNTNNHIVKLIKSSRSWYFGKKYKQGLTFRDLVKDKTEFEQHCNKRDNMGIYTYKPMLINFETAMKWTIF